MRRKNEELAQACRDKSRRLLQTQELYDKVKRKAEISQIQRAASDAVDTSLHVAPQLHKYQQRQNLDLNTQPAFRLNCDRTEAFGLDSGISTAMSRGIDEDRWPSGARIAHCRSVPKTRQPFQSDNHVQPGISTARVVPMCVRDWAMVRLLESLAMQLIR